MRIVRRNSSSKLRSVYSVLLVLMLLAQAAVATETSSSLPSERLSRAVQYRAITQPDPVGQSSNPGTQSARTSDRVTTGAQLPGAGLEDLKVRWTANSGGERSDRFNSVVSRRTDLVSIAVGSTMSRSSGRRDAWVAAFDSAGRLIWETPVGGSRDDEAFGVVDLPDGSIVFVGATSSTGSGTSAGIVAKLNQHGTVMWETLIDTPAADYLYAITTLSTGDLVVAGTSDSREALVARLDTEGTVVWQKNYVADEPNIVNDLAVFGNDDVLLVGERSEMFDADAALARISSAGNVVWHQTFGGAGMDKLTGGVTLVNDDILVVGVTNDEEMDDQGWLLRYSGKGERQWEKTFGGAGMDRLSGIRVLGDQSLVIAGTADATEEEQLNSWILRISDSGDVLRVKRLGSEFSDGFMDLSPRMDGSFVAVGFNHNWQGDSSDGYIAMLGMPVTRAALPVRAADDPPTVFIPGGGKLLTSEPTVEMIGNIIHDRPITSLFVDGRPARLLHNGAFLTRVSVPLGVTEVKVEAIDDRGVLGESIVQVTRAEVSDLAMTGQIPDLDSINFGNFHALVIGNNFYNGDIPPLKTAIKDTTELASLLQDTYGFEVELLLNADKDQILNALNEKSETLRKDDNLLVYYAGHGVYDEDADVGYWLPVDADLEDKSNWILNSTITDTIKGMDAKHVLLMADSCFSGTLLRSTQVKRTGKFYTQMATRTARLVMTSGGVEPVMDGGGDGHSVFARSLLAKLRSPEVIIDGTSLYQAIREPVVMSSEQVPQYSNIRFIDSDGGDFLFVKRN
jgi:hypothetical protein